MSEMFSRRSFLKLSGALAAASALAACSGGSGSTGNGNSSGGNGGNSYKEVANNLSMLAPIGFSASGPIGSYSSFYIHFMFKNSGKSDIAISTKNFTEVSCNGHTIHPIGINSPTSQTYNLPAGKEETISLYLNPTDAWNHLTIDNHFVSNITVVFTYSSKKATYSGSVPALTPMIVTDA